MRTITQRCVVLLGMLCDAGGPVPVRELSARLNVSERVVRYSLDQLKDWLGDQGIELQSVPRRGPYLDPDNRTAAKKLLDEHYVSSAETGRYLSAEEREGSIILDILSGDAPESIERWPDKLGVSRSTFLRDLEHVGEWFEERGAPLLRRQRKGVSLDADEAARRRLIVDFIFERVDERRLLTCMMLDVRSAGKVSPVSSFSYVNELLSIVRVREVADALEEVTGARELAVSDNDFMWLVVGVCVAVARAADGWTLPEGDGGAAPRVDGSTSALVASLFPDNLAQADLLAEVCCISSWLDVMSPLGERDEREAASLEAASYVCTRFEEVLGLSLAEDDSLLDMFRAHVRAAIDRARAGNPAKNPLLDTIKQRYPVYFDISSTIAGEVERRYGVVLDEAEVGFTAMYAAAAMERERQLGPEAHKLKACLVCGFGLGTVSLLMNSLRSRFPDIEISERLSVFDVMSHDFSGVDMVLTTVDIPVPLLCPSIKVSPLLTSVDCRRIASFVRQRASYRTGAQHMSVEAVLAAVERHCEIRDYDALSAELGQLLGVPQQEAAACGQTPLSQVVTRSKTLAGGCADNWERAVSLSANVLFGGSELARGFTDEVVGMRDGFGQWSVLSNGICIPHAYPKPSYELGMTLVTLERPFKVSIDGAESEVRVIMALSSPSNEAQGLAIEQAFGIFEEHPDVADILCSASNSDELYAVFQGLCGEG